MKSEIQREFRPGSQELHTLKKHARETADRLRLAADPTLWPLAAAYDKLAEAVNEIEAGLAKRTKIAERTRLENERRNSR
jgi:hypothetical protein